MLSDSRSLTVFSIIFLVELSYEYFVIQLNVKYFSISREFTHVEKSFKILKIPQCSLISL